MSSRRSSSVPSYRLHKQSGQAVVTLSDPLTKRRKDQLLGAYGTPESRAEYARVIAEWEAGGRCMLHRKANTDLTINELAAAFWAGVDCSGPVKAPEYKLVFKVLSELFGHTLAAEFGPLKLKAFRDRLIQDGLSRGTVNQRIWRVKKLFAWGVENELVPAAAWHGLLAVKGLARGRSAARETEPIKPVPADHVEAILPFLPPTVRAMVEIQRLTGMRPGEVCRMRCCDIDTTGAIWLYRPSMHKNQWRGKDRIIAIGPKGKLLLKPFMNGKPEAFLFSPADAMAYHWQVRRKSRKTKVQPSQLDRRKPNPERQPGDCYDAKSYGRAVVAACRKAKLPDWRPNRLRHLHATMVRKNYGLEAAQAALGHSKMNVTEVYAEKNLDLAIKVATEVG